MMKISDIKFMVREIQALKKHYDVINDKRWKEASEQFGIIKAMHSIEKGLSLKNPRTGFGILKATRLIEKIEAYCKAGYSCEHASVQMAMNALFEYVEWNKAKGFDVSEIEEKLKKLREKIVEGDIDGGTITLNRSDVLDIKADELTKIINSRHSVRHFGEKNIDIEDVKKAVEEANRCPSACNRQPTRVHIIADEEEKRFFSERLQGVGGFADECGAFLLITSNISAFDFDENNQWIVSAGIFTGYLTLCLHARGIASCVIQRPLIRSKKIVELRERLRLPDNEEIVCSIGIGSYPDKLSVPVSARLEAEEIVSVH